MRRTAVATLFLCLTFAATLAVAQDRCWVSGSETPLKTFGSSYAEDVAFLAAGAELQVTERAGDWLRVETTDGREGWIAAAQVADTPPAAEVREAAPPVATQPAAATSAATPPSDAAVPAEPEQRWVISDDTTLKAFGAVSAEDVAPLPVGTALQVLDKAGRWIKVRTADGPEGWVYAGRLADTPPEAEVAEDSGLFGGLFQDSQIQTAKADSARSIRGLSPETASYAQQRGTPEAYQTELDGILKRETSAQQLKAFLRAGRIGEYAM